MKRRNFLKSTAVLVGGLALGATACKNNTQQQNKSKGKPIIVIHGGTSGLGLTEEEFNARQQVMLESLKAGQSILANGGSSIDAVIAAIKIMEDSPLFNAGKGAVFTADGFNELDASIMDGSTRKAGAVAMSRKIKNPVEAAKLVMDKTKHTLIAGDGADRLAEKYKLKLEDQNYFFTEHRYKQLQDARAKEEVLLDSDNEKDGKPSAHLGSSTEPYLGTVGAIAFDSAGNLAAATSTGGLTNKMTGRIGDSPIIGSGNYADNSSVAVSCTGTGDIFMRAVAAHEVAAIYKYAKVSVEKAAQDTIKQVDELGGTGGIIAIDKYGNPGYAWTKDKLGMYHGQARVGEEPKVFWPLGEKADNKGK